MASELKLKPGSITGVFRDGPRKPGSSRILKVCWSDRGDRLSFMKTVRGLQKTNNPRWEKIWSRPDLTWIQRDNDRKLRFQLNERKANGELDLYIKNGVIHKKGVREDGD